MKKLLSIAAIFAVAEISFGAGFGIYEGSARGNAMGGAVIGDASDASAAYHNPANVAFTTNIQVAVGATFINPYCDVQVDHKSQDRMNPGWFTVPHFYVTIPLWWDLAFSWGNYTEFGLGSKYARNWDLAGDTQQTTLSQITLNPTLSYKITDWWSVAAGPRISWIQFKNHKQPYSGDTYTQVGENGLYTASITDAYHLDTKLKGEDWGAGWMAATTVKPTEDLSIGLVYRSQIRHKISGDFKLNGYVGGTPNITVNQSAVNAYVQGIANEYASKAYQQYLPYGQAVAQQAATQAGQQAASTATTQLQQKLAAAQGQETKVKQHTYQRASARLRLPESITIGANYNVTERYRVGTSFTYTRWSSVKNIGFRIGGGYGYSLPLHWRDTVRVGFGMEYDFTDWLSGRIGYTYDEDPSRKSRASTMLPAGDRHIIGIGTGIMLLDNLRLDLGYSFIRMNNQHYWIKTTDQNGNESRKYFSCHNGFSHLASATLNYSF